MFHANLQLNPNLAAALNLLEIKENHLRDEKGEEVNVVSPIEHAKALFSYFHMAGYLNEDLLKKAVQYLSASKAFACDDDTVFSDLKEACDKATSNGRFDVDVFMVNFAQQKYFTPADAVDLIVFLQQTAFDRQHGQERDRLQGRPWMEEHSLEFQDIATKLGVVTPLPPLKREYSEGCIMGAASKRVRERLIYFQNLEINCNLIWALSGARELSKGLDEEVMMEAVAAYLGKPLKYVKKRVGDSGEYREFLEGITETMMVNYFIQTLCPAKKIGILDSGVEAGHWRATAAQSAADIASMRVKDFIRALQSGEVAAGYQHDVLIIAEQPYTRRMTMQIQREFNKAIKDAGLEEKVRVIVEGSGQGISEQDLLSTPVLARLNSELAALMAERFNRARSVLQQQAHLELRDPSILMFNKRDAVFQARKAAEVANDKASQLELRSALQI
ncbi:MAG: hypothetical protein K0S27_506 [Gammaproteobacteria bacterium]|jgi:hypothetical protein|nr:hypothetical protein [Gammaproteobacteria bacterium]